MLKKLSTYLFILLGFLDVYAQNIPEKGVQRIENYLPQQYGNHGKIWQISSANNGLVYMASDNGLLEFDGKTWKKNRAYKGFTRSLYIANDSTIYIGADHDFGVWHLSRSKKNKYKSLYPVIKNSNHENEEFWNTFYQNGNLLFISHNHIYEYKNNHITKFRAPYRFSGSYAADGKIFLSDEKYGLYEFRDHTLVNLAKNTTENNFSISGIYQTSKGLFIITKNLGIYQYVNGTLQSYSSEVSLELKKHKAFSFSKIGNQYLAFGTILNGVYLTDLNGKIIQHINKTKGLANNTVLSLFYASNGKLWLGLDYGISEIFLNSNLSYFYDSSGDFGTAYSALLLQNNFYLGTNQGLYLANWDRLNTTSSAFQLIPGSEGQVWSLKQINGAVLCGHDKGLFIAENHQIKQISNQPGVLSLELYKNNYLLVGTYNGILIFKKEANSWIFFKKMDLIQGAVSQIIEQGQWIWINIPNYGIIKCQLDKNLLPIKRKFFIDKNFKGDFPKIIQDKKGIHVTTKDGQYIYQEYKNEFQKENQFSVPDVSNLLEGVYEPLHLNNEYNFYPISNGFALENLKQNDKNFPFYPLQIRNVQTFNNKDSLSIKRGERVSYHQNNIRFIFLVPNTDQAVYQYKLLNYTDQWSVWDKKNSITYLNLPPGSYEFQVRAKFNNRISLVQTFKLKILSPWYRSWVALFIYALLFCLLYYSLRKRQQEKLKKQKLALLKKEQKSLRELSEKHQQEVLIQKQKQLENEKENLKLQIKNKTIELATKAKEDEDKNRLLHLLREKMQEAENNPSISKMKWSEMRRLLNSYLEIDDHTFEIQMDELHQEFFKLLKEKFPSLSIYDLRLCAYLKIGLSSKEMADILHVLPSSINVSRSRLRKKLDLKPEDDLYEFLNQFT